MAKSKVHRRGAATPEMNMTPLIAVTFQLIIFFMLINNIITDQTVEMIVPTLDEPKTRRFEDEKKIIVNVAPIEHVLPGQYNLKERRDSPLEARDREEIGAIRVGSTEFKLQGGNNVVTIDVALKGLEDYLSAQRKADNEIEVEVRADCALLYDQVQLVLAAISAAEIGTVHLVAYLPEDAR